MTSAKEIRIAPIDSHIAHFFIKTHHYSGKSVSNSQLHLGMSLRGQLVGVLQFGPPLDRRKLLGLVKGTSWNGFLELNRLAMIDDTPKNTESRALGVAMRLLRKQYPHLEWVVSFADATQCGDGTIYRAAGFVLTGIKRNNQIWEAPTGARFSRTSLTDGRSKGQQGEAVRISRVSATRAKNILQTGGASMRQFAEAGFKPLPGYQLRYIYFLNSDCRARLAVPEIPFSRIAQIGAAMYKGKRAKDSSEPAANHAAEGGAAPTRTLHDFFPMAKRMLAR